MSNQGIQKGNLIYDTIIIIVWTLCAFWVIVTGVTIIPQLTGELLAYIYAIGTLFLSVIIGYTGCKLAGLTEK